MSEIFDSQIAVAKDMITTSTNKSLSNDRTVVSLKRVVDDCKKMVIYIVA